VYDEVRLVFLYGLTPAHPGTGQAVGTVDLPVQRESHSGLPVIQGSGVKGAWRDRREAGGQRADPLVLAAFGPPTGQAHEYGGALAFTDARLLAFPVRSAAGLVAWVTSPMVWSRFVRDAGLAGGSPPPAPAVSREQALASGGACILDGSLVLEAYRFAGAVDDGARACAEWLRDREAVDPAMADFLVERLVFVEDEVLRDLTVHGAEVVARIALSEETGTTSGRGGNLWYEELVPSETLFYLLVLASDARVQLNGRRYSAREIIDVVAVDDGEVVQLGGEATVGRGLFRARMLGGEER
jgi:CRISPR-associated protein Cmr4